MEQTVESLMATVRQFEAGAIANDNKIVTLARREVFA